MPRIALIAHDAKKSELTAFVTEHIETFRTCTIIATETTATYLHEQTGLTVEHVASGPLGGDLMIGAEVAENALDGVIFLRDPLCAHSHEPDITALLRICDVHTTPLATNLGSATIFIKELERAVSNVKLEDERRNTDSYLGFPHCSCTTDRSVGKLCDCDTGMDG